MATPERDAAQLSSTRTPVRNPLLVPLVAVSALALAEAVWIGVLSARGGSSTPQAVQQGAPAAQQQGAPPATAPAPGGEGVTRGKAGERVESAGLAITVVGVSNERQGLAKQLVSVGEDEKYHDIEVLIENNTGRAFKYFTTGFKLTDSQHYDYQPNTLRVSRPILDYGTVVQGGKVRGHIEFTVPKKATGLTLVYPDADLAGYKAIQIELGQ